MNIRKEKDDGVKPSTSQRRYPIFNLFAKNASLFECIPCEDFPTRFPSLMKFGTPQQQPMDVGPDGPQNGAGGPPEGAGVPPGGPPEGREGPSTNTSDTSSDDMDLLKEKPYLDCEVDLWQECCRDPQLKSVMLDFLDMDWNDHFEIHPSIAINDPDENIEFLRNNRTLASFLAAATTVVDEVLAARIVYNFPSLISDMESKPKEQLKYFLRYFKPEEFSSMASSLMDQFEATHSFVGPLCSVEVQILMMAQNMSSGDTKF